MKKISLTFLAVAVAVCVSAQTMVDSLVYRPAAAVDSSLVGRDIFNLLPSKDKGDAADITVNQSKDIADAMKSYVAANPGRKQTGYRVRIYFDNTRDARKSSEETERRFMLEHPGITAYRSYQNPFFKVTVGDFRTKSEAMALLNSIKSEYPAAFIVREEIGYPAADRERTYVTDTVKVQR